MYLAVKHGAKQVLGEGSQASCFEGTLRGWEHAWGNFAFSEVNCCHLRDKRIISGPQFQVSSTF